MGGKKKGEEEIWKKMNLIKEIKKRIGVKKRGWIVKKKKFRIVNDEGGKRKKLIKEERKSERKMEEESGEEKLIKCLRKMIF